MTDKNLDFVLRHYREDALDTTDALHSVQARAGMQPPRRPSPWRWVAVAASLLCLVAVAAVLTVFRPTPSAPSPVAQSTSVAAAVQPDTTTATAPMTFHFDDTPLPEVLEALSAHYGVTLTTDRPEQHLTGDFDADSLTTVIRMIEEVLDVKISLRQE
ncbi:MAG: DUF4974 domain-containing protein [Prevotella sp.]|nr:DUF4974 domain-containing protein [Prevotella sp.]